MELKIGLSAQSQTTVNENNTAEALSSGFLAVFASPSMIALMENAAAKSVAPCLDSNSTTVGTQLNVAHLKATGLNDIVTATATLTAIDGRKLTFDVEASDSQGLIGKGTHERFIIDSEKFMAKLKKN